MKRSYLSSAELGRRVKGSWGAGVVALVGMGAILLFKELEGKALEKLWDGYPVIAVMLLLLCLSPVGLWIYRHGWPDPRENGEEAFREELRKANAGVDDRGRGQPEPLNCIRVADLTADHEEER